MPVTGRAWAGLRLAGTAAVLAFLVVRVGAGPFAAGLRSVDVRSVLAASGIAVVTTACCTWRWCLVARGIGLPLAFGPAFAAYYRSQFLNTALPGGILGDLHRGARHGRAASSPGRGLRAVAWERLAGQAVLLGIAVCVLTVLRSPVRATMPMVLLLGAGCVALLAWGVRAAARGGSATGARVARVMAADLSDGIAAQRRWVGVVGTSALAVAGHVATFVLAARAVGSTAPLTDLLPLTLLVLVGAAVPVNVGGWGPREGVAAWVFAAAGLGAGQGVAAGAAYGVLVAAASLPGAVVLLVGRFDGASRRTAPVPVRVTEASRETARIGATVGEGY